MSAHLGKVGDAMQTKACKILKDGVINGKPLTNAQRGMFGARCSGTSRPTRTRR